MSLQDFKNLFAFSPDLVWNKGVEREVFLVGTGGEIVARADEVIQYIRARGWPSSHGYSDPGYTVGYELSNAQIELRTRPHPNLKSLRTELEWNDANLKQSLQEIGLATLHTEVGPVDMPLDIYPDPTGRYQIITENMPRSVLLAACRVIGTHVHVGMQDHDMALRVYNYVVKHLEELCEAGNGSFGERLAIYRQMAPDYQPKPYASWDEYYQTALVKGFSEDPRKCWTLIRISVHGTIEFRMFGATDSVDRILGWVERCQTLCQEAQTMA